LLTKYRNKNKCKRCKYIWLPVGSRLIPKNGNLYMIDLGLCVVCDHAKSRLQIASPGDQFNAELWGRQKFEIIIKKEND
jgi:hypothetical protein